jgi:hypothetical protein
VLVRSTPADAQVLVDGRERGRTPATVEDLAPGAHRVRVVHEGYASQDRTIVVTTERPVQSLTVDLEQSNSLTPSPARTPAPAAAAVDGEAVGALDVESRPIGAQVFLDDTLVGTTPFASARVPAGKHSIRLEYTGYRQWESSVSIMRNERNRITASLEQ